MDGCRYTALFEAPSGKPVLEAYADPITKGAPWTIGLGHTGPEVKEGTVWDEDRCWAAFQNDYAIAASIASQLVGTLAWSTLSDQRRAVIADMAFNMGGTRLSEFQEMLAAVRNGDWRVARIELLDSNYAGELQHRATTNANTLFTGEWPIAA